MIVRAAHADRDGRLLRRIRLLTEEGRIQERLRLAQRLQERVDRLQDRRLDLIPEMPAAHLPARDAVRRAEWALREASVSAETPVPLPVEAPRRRLFDRLRRRITDGPPPVAAPKDGPAEAARDARRHAREAAERNLRDARRALALIEDEHARYVAATEAERNIALARLARGTAQAEAALALLAEDDGWTARGLPALMRAARQARHEAAFDQAPAEGVEPEAEASGPGARFP